MTYADDLRKFGPTGPFSQALLVTLAGLTADPAVVLVTDGDTRWEVVCLVSYDDRQINDRLLAVQMDGGVWVALGKVGGAFTIPDLTVSTVDAVTWDGTNRSRSPLRVDAARSVLWTLPGPIGGTINSMIARITRTDSGAPVPLRLGLWTQVYPPVVSNRWTTGVYLVPGQTAFVPIPPTQRSLIASGRGLVAYAETDEHAAEFSADLSLIIDLA